MKGQSTLNSVEKRQPRTLRHPIVSVFLFLLSSLTNSAIADQALYDQANKLLAAGDAESAYQLLISEEIHLAGKVQFDYLLGLAAYESGKINLAIFSFQRALSVDANFAGARMDLARAYYEIN